MNRHNLGTVISFEFRRTVLKPKFWLISLAVPLLIAVVVALIAISGQTTADRAQSQDQEAVTFTYTDASGLIDPATATAAGGTLVTDGATARAAVVAGTSECHIDYPSDPLSRPIQVSGQDLGLFDSERYAAVASSVFEESIVHQIGNPRLAQLAVQGPDVQLVTFADGVATPGIAGVIVPALFLVLFYLAVLMLGNQIFARFLPEAVIHFAGWKAVGESVAKPLVYYRENLDSTLTLLETMQRHGCTRIVFSSSATVYGAGEPPLSEDAPTGATNPYGRTKLMIEEILADASVADPDLAVGVLRYFNPIGAHASGMIGEDPQGIPNNLVPYVAQVATGRRAELSVFGDDYDTPDGTGIRDYIHVLDLAAGHLAALDYIRDHAGYHVWNLGTGRGTSVFEIISAYERACGHPIPYQVLPRRAGDVARSFADPSKAKRELGWEATRGIDEMCVDSYRWQSNNPRGFTA